MNINGFCASVPTHQYEEEDIFDPDMDVLEDDDSSNAVVIQQPVVSPSLGGSLVNPNLPADDKFAIIANALLFGGKELFEIKQQLDVSDRKIIQLEDDFDKEKAIYEKKLSEQEEIILQLQANQDEISLQKEREEWIQNHKPSGITAYAGGATIRSYVSWCWSSLCRAICTFYCFGA